MSRPSPELLLRLGRSLREIDPSSLQQEQGEDPVRWFLGDSGTELFAWGVPGAPPRHLQLVFFRVSLEWTREQGLRTGSFDAQSSTSGGRYDPYLMTLGPAVDPQVCRAALALLEASRVDPAVLAPLRKALAAALMEPGSASR
ncbi:hypothetical protein FGE12_00785 [Aggregicoccus sp. 17bor-14]|uniref:hypothetical protein n=1 Tax=Myxococcaceae TaxID=31 RepID=UPI00129CDEF7|nr:MULTISPECIES: hypothetical protein [Myxococcaceae]MBF5040907.1 hypothetical protein [Simulacricoccus sp. 17bor-14]MRI86695.1 hypothetical protein [Aggregicoccus sp. 17bor-14]